MAAAAPSDSLRDVFQAFASFGDSKSKGHTISLTNSDKWMKQAKVIGAKVTTTDTGNAFKKFKKNKIDYDTFVNYLEELARNKQMDVTEIRERLESAGKPGLATTAKAPSGPSSPERSTTMKRLSGAFRRQADDKNVAKVREERKEERQDDQNLSDPPNPLGDPQNLLGPHGPLEDRDVEAEAISKEEEYVNGPANKNIEEHLENVENKSNNE